MNNLSQGTDFGDTASPVEHFLTNVSGDWILSRCSTANIPVGKAGYAIGGQIQTNDTGITYVNSGTTLSSLFTISGQAASLQVSLSSAQILALNATPVTLVPAPGTGKAIIVNSIIFSMTTTATQYANGGVLEFRYTNASGAQVTGTIAAAVVNAAAGTSTTTVVGIGVTPVLNAPVVIDNATAPFITGTGTARVTVLYDIVTP